MMNISKKPSNNILLSLPDEKKTAVLYDSIEKDNLRMFIKSVSAGSLNKDSSWTKKLLSKIVHDYAVNIFKYVVKNIKIFERINPDSVSLLLHLVTTVGDFTLLKYLIKNTNVDINSKNPYSDISYLGLCLYSPVSLGIFKFLLDKGANPNTKEIDGNYVIHNLSKKTSSLVNPKARIVEFKKYNEMLEYLISKGADVNVLNSKGKTPLDLAYKHKQHDRANILEKHGGLET